MLVSFEKYPIPLHGACGPEEENSPVRTTTLNATTSGWLVGGMAAFGVAAGSYAVWAGMRLVPDRRRYAQWDAEWGLVEPRWSARFRP